MTSQITWIKQKDHIKQLGVVIDSHPNFKEDIHQQNKKKSPGEGRSILYANKHVRTWEIGRIFFKKDFLL